MNKVLVIGGGGREHALCWKIARPDGEKGLLRPGNAGIAERPSACPSPTPTSRGCRTSPAKRRST